MNFPVNYGSHSGSFVLATMVFMTYYPELPIMIPIKGASPHSSSVASVSCIRAGTILSYAAMAEQLANDETKGKNF